MSETSLRAECGLHSLTRRSAPGKVCKCELRAAASAVRCEEGRYVIGLLKVEGAW